MKNIILSPLSRKDTSVKREGCKGKKGNWGEDLVLGKRGQTRRHMAEIVGCPGSLQQALRRTTHPEKTPPMHTLPARARSNIMLPNLTSLWYCFSTCEVQSPALQPDPLIWRKQQKEAVEPQLPTP